MQSSTLGFVRRLGACVAGVVLIVAGLSGFVSEFATPDPASTETAYAGMAMAICGVIIAWGAVLCLAARFPYALGVRLSLGVFCFSVAAIAAGYFVDLCLMGFVSLPALALIFLMFQSGCYCTSVRRHASRPSQTNAGSMMPRSQFYWDKDYVPDKRKLF